MLQYAGYSVAITQSIARDYANLPSDLKCAYNVKLDVGDKVVCREVTPISLNMDVALYDLAQSDTISIRIDSNIDFSYWIVAVVKYIDFIADPEYNGAVAYMRAMIAANIAQLWIPERKDVIDIMPGYRYVIWRAVKPWLKLYSVLKVTRDGVIAAVKDNDWQIVIHRVASNEYDVAVRLGADNYRNAPCCGTIIDDFVDLYRCLYLEPDISDFSDFSDFSDNE